MRIVHTDIFWRRFDQTKEGEGEPISRFFKGLELDWVCVTWDGDFRFTDRGWAYHSFLGSGWRNIHKQERQSYLRNAYRVLLTRARQGMVIKVNRRETMAMRTHPNGPVRLGLIGCGWVVQNCHLPALHALSDARVVAVADTNRDLLDQVAERFQIERRYTSHQALLDDQSLEAVVICVPTQHHVDVALPAIDAGKHIFIEKPLALSLHDCDRLMERASQATVKIMLGFNMRWHRLVRRARTIVQQGELGPLLAIRSVYSSCARHRTGGPEWVKRRELGGGVLVEQAVHHFDAWRFLLQCEIEEVYAATRSDERDDTTGTVTARFTNGVLACGLFSQSTSNNNELEIYGQAGRLQVSCYRFDGLDHFSKSDAPGSLQSRLRAISQTLRGLPEGVRNLRHGGGFMASYRAEWRHFLDGIRYDKPMECTLEDGRRALQVVLAAVASADRGRPVKIEQAPERVEG